ncbi:MAG TPA: M23 family metallopeptidase, partial [Terriglobales bacterium]|nr:M23 family metallopeptidase [Terriglobales bacterium]
SPAGTKAAGYIGNMRRALGAGMVAAVLLLARLALAQNPTAVAPAWQVRLEPATLVNGAPALLYVLPPVRLKALSGSWMGHELYFSFDPDIRSWYALFGASLNSAPGTYKLSLEGETDTGNTASFEQNLEVASEPYATVELKVAHKFTAPNPRLLKRIRREEILKHRIFEETNSKQLWAGDFTAPVTESVSEPFGVRRVFNGELKTEHQGLDYHAPRGTRVVAANSGTVLLARRLFFEGNCVIVDHGQGLMTLYMHLSKFKVRKGQKIRRGQLLGLSGATGRATGPHLHLAVRWEGIYLDPAKLLKLDMPSAEAVHSAAAESKAKLTQF